ncbi:MAG: thiolase domain-containing protein [Anaerolineae bacterium]|nr:thiolase domain-containing protein [Anaerolineae bacterium]
MRKAAIIGVGQTPVGEHWDASIRMIAADAVHAALEDAGLKSVDALYVGNAYGASFSSQSQLGALIADYSGLGGVETFTVEAGDASGGAALRTGYLAVASGAVETALVLGVEKSTDTVSTAHTRARNVSLDADYEAVQGATLTALAALVMRRYMHEYGVDLSAFENFSINAHANGGKNANAMYRNQIKPGAFARAPMISEPVSLFDSAPDADGAAAVIITSGERAGDLVPRPVEILGSAAASDTLALAERADLLDLSAVRASVYRAFQQAGVTHRDIDLFELHDAFTILSALTLEAAGFAERGQGWKLAKDGQIGLAGELPLCTFGGLKSRGNPVGATGVYQAVEAALQLRGAAGANQVPDARIALIQNIGGFGSTAITHILSV